jgi:CheY-like chemotaxis protein
MLRERLQRRGYAVSIACNGREGVARARSDSPDLVIMDMILPLLDGWEATRLLKADPLTRHIPVLGLSSSVMAADRERARSAGCDDFATKPVDFPRLLAKIDALLAARQDAQRP